MSFWLSEMMKPHTEMAKPLLEMTKPRGLSISISLLMKNW